jgi:hypothetical protein
MASTKAYQARKQDIAALNVKLAEAEYQNRKMAQELRVMKFRCDILKDYIRHAYWDDVTNPVLTPSTIPSCLKPFDAIKFAGGEPMAFPPKAED